MDMRGLWPTGGVPSARLVRDERGPRPAHADGGGAWRAPDVLQLSAPARSAHEAAGATPTRWHFGAEEFPGFYDASDDADAIYDVGRMRDATPGIWADFGPLFKQVGAELGVDPYALAAYAMFESYNHLSRNLTPRALNVEGRMVAAGIAATQAQDWAGKRIPGTSRYFPPTTWATAEHLRNHPADAVRAQAATMKWAYESSGEDLAYGFPRAAFPNWGDPNRRRGAYGTQAQYVSRAYVFYRAFVEADQAT